MKAVETRIHLRHSKSVVHAAVSGIFSGIGSKLSLECLDHLNSGRYMELISLEVDPSAYDCSSAFADDYLCAELLSKFPDFPVGIDRRLVALQKFEEAERQCCETNDRLKTSYGVASTTTSFASILYAAQRKIARLLGPFNWDEAARHFSWGPGASTQVRSREGDAYFKFGVTKPQVTTSCAMLAACAIAQSPAWYKQVAGLSGSDSFTMPSPAIIARDHLDLVEGNRIVTVPKNAKTDRVIAIEPHMNMYIQKGIGAVIRRRLLRAGIDLNDQTLNQRLAREASLSGDLATIDLSAASDTISMELVQQLLPDDWFLAIKLTRSPVGVLPDGRQITYQKVSSMGNGFTFELESLIFWALLLSVVEATCRGAEHRIGVYGDDLILPCDSVPFFLDVLKFVGFKTNPKKSFWSGPFRESCGKHYFKGFDVSPFYIREDVNTTMRYFWLANSIRRWAGNRFAYGCDGRLESAYRTVLRFLPKNLRVPTIPDGYGDGSLIGDLDEVCPPRHRTWDGWVVRTFIPDPHRKRVTGSALLLKQLSSPATGAVWWEKRVPPQVLQSVIDGGHSSRCDTLLYDRPRAKQCKLFVPDRKSVV